MDDSTQRGASREALINDALSEILGMLESARGSARHRELRAQARSYELAVKRWISAPATPTQLEAMFELVAELHGKVVAASRQRSR